MAALATSWAWGRSVVHGTPDWNVTAGRATTHPLTDLGELAVRLGSINNFDRRGDVIFMETFEEGTLCKWQLTEVEDGSSVTLSALRARTGALSCLLTAGGAAGSKAAITHYCPYSVLSAFGLEAAISRDVILTSLAFHLDLYDGENVTECELRWSLHDNVLSYINESGAPVPLGTVYMSTETSAFHVFKLVVDGVNNEYARAIVNDQAFSLKDIAARVTESEILPVLFFQIELKGGTDLESEVWVDNVIITQNEPT